MAFQLQNCSDEEQVLLVSTDLTDYSNRILVLEEYAGICWIVLDEETEDVGEVVTITNCFFSCEDCQKVAYLLTDCTGRLQPLRSTQENLGDYVGNIIKVPYYDNSCFTVSLIEYDPTLDYHLIEYSRVYDTCHECRQRRTIEPGYNVVSCNPEYAEKVNCKFAEIIYNRVLSEKFGVEFCCPEDYTKWKIKQMLVDNELINYDSPELPEPFVESCCIDTNLTCVEPCSDCNQNLMEETECPCYCLASSDSPHDCHTYTFEVVPEMINDATGNDESQLNGRVYFGYFECKKTKVTTVSYTNEDQGEKEYCVLGIPLLGWFKDNEWVNYDSIEGIILTRGEVCEEEIDETCNTCD